jgi:hypothetical protein
MEAQIKKPKLTTAERKATADARLAALRGTGGLGRRLTNDAGPARHTNSVAADAIRRG